MGLIRSMNKFQDVFRALIVQKKLDAYKWSRQELINHQKQRLSSLVQYAVRFSPFYKELYRNVRAEDGINLKDLPVINKAMMMEHFDTFVTDPKLRLQGLQAHISQITRDDPLYLDEYRVHTTSGSTGLKGVFVSNREEWRTASANYLRSGAIIGAKPRVPRCKMALVIAGSPVHVSYRASVSNDVGVVNFKRLEAIAPVEELVDALNEFQPECLTGYPSIVSLLAIEQLEGRLHIHPRVTATTGELLTRDMSQKIDEAWGVIPYNYYGLTEAGVFLGAECSFHQGIHVFEDFFIVEVVDKNNEPVPDGTTGDKFLLTNLFNFTQPLIRYEIADVISLASEPCSCGSSFKRIAVMDGRSDDFLRLPGRRGTNICIHPMNFHGPLAAFPEIKEYQIIQEPDGIDVLLVLRQGIYGDQVIERIKTKLREQIDSLGAICPDIRPRTVPQLERDYRKMGKRTLVKCNIDKGQLSR